MNKSSVSRMQRFTYFQILCNVLGRKIVLVQRFTTIQNFWTQLMESRWNSSGISSQDSPHCSSATKSMSSCPKWAIHQNSKDELSSCRCSMTSHGDLKTMNGNANSDLVSIFAKRFPTGRWSFFGLGSEKKWCSTYNERSQREWERVAESMMIRFGESGHPVFRATSPLSRGTLKSKGGGKLSLHFCSDGDTIETVFRTSTEQSQMCENTALVKQERRDPYWQDNLTHCLSQQVC